MLETFRKVLDLLDARERRRFWWLLAGVVAMGVINMVGVASIVPFLAVLGDGEIVERNRWLAAVYDALGFQDRETFLIWLGATVVCAYLAGLLVKAAATYALIRFGAMRNYSVASRMLRAYLGQPYVWFLDRHSADLIKSVMNEVSQVVNGVVIPMLNVFAQAVIVIAMTLLLLLVQPMAAVAAIGVLGGCYALIYLAARRRLLRLGQERMDANRARFRAAQEGMTGIKEVKVMGLEEGVLRRFRFPAMRFAETMAQAGAINDLPRHALEGIAFAGMMALLLVLMSATDGDVGAVLPVIGVYAVAGSRLSPSLQQIYRDFAKLRAGRPVLDSVHADFTATADAPAPHAPPEPLGLREGLVLRGVAYAYPGAGRGAVNGLTLEVPVRSTIGIVGGTGAGKTTAVDLMLGLLEPQEGALEVDGRALSGDPQALRAWRRSVGYVPQQIFLMDASVAENIAFGVAPREIDMAAVERAARMAELHDFVTSDLPQGYRTDVGDRGVRLSGGQRQRIGIARALYNDPDLLIFDEATSALDNITERTVMSSVASLGGTRTIVIIAHRLSTVQGCDRIFLLENGQVAAQGPYEELLSTSPAFRDLALGARA